MILKDAVLQTWLDSVSENQSEDLKFYYITNKNKSIRWLWPAKNKRPLFLKFYNTSSIKARIGAFSLKLLFVLKLQRFVVKKGRGSFSHFSKEYDLDHSKEWALFTGTEGPNRKVVLFAHKQNGQSCFTKIAIGKNALEMIKQETFAIKNLASLHSSKVNTPKIITCSHKHIQLTDVNSGANSSSLSEPLLSYLSDINSQSSSVCTIQKLTAFKTAMDSYRELSIQDDYRLPKAMLRKSQWLINSIDVNSTVKTSTAHGDFTPWNCQVSEDQVSLFDFEMAQENMPKAYDAFHFIIQNGILVKQNSWKYIQDEIDEVITPNLFNGDKDETKKYLKLYLLINIAYYFKTYSQQTHWHLQINWLLKTWNDAISAVLSDDIRARKLLLMDTFDFMQNKTYCALKFKGYLPEEVSKQSDVDLCVCKEDAIALKQYLESHPLVSKARVRHLSFMKNIDLVLTNSELLSIDCIWKLRRKNIIIKDIIKLIKSATTNVFGVKQPSATLEAQYVNRFYTINGAKTPIAYRSKSFEMRLENDAKSTNPKLIRQALLSKLRKQKTNRGLSYLRNTFNYCVDTVKSLANQRGFVVTFSGVDGAGKSTLIAIIEHQITKQLRKPVVVLRHRPSLLPILSAWTMGKSAAEKKAATTLPRQGNNKSKASSLARFSYYYTDYLLGQFYIYFRYVLRGRVVIYDRYYFDFINDSRRSNINLPKWLTKSAFKLIIKPHINFFLYADAKTILARKKELDAHTITSLTNNYLELFEELNQNHQNRKYLPIKNIDLDTTTRVIFNHVKLQVA